jgi:hypothetical protein
MITSIRTWGVGLLVGLVSPGPAHAARPSMGMMRSGMTGNMRPIVMNNNMRSMSPLFNRYAMMATNPYGGGMSGYGSMSGSGGGSYGSMSGSGYGGGGGGGGGGGSTPRPRQDYSPSLQAQLKSLPVDVLNWPIGLRVLGPFPEAQVLRRGIEDDVLQVMRQFSEGQVNDQLLNRARTSVSRMRVLLADSEGKRSQGTVNKGRRFLQSLDQALKQY